MFDQDDNSHLNSYQTDIFLLRKDMQEYISDSLLSPKKKKQQKRRSKQNNSWAVSEMRTEDGVVTSEGWKRVEALTKTVLKRHFSTISIYNDLVQIGMIKAASVLSEDPEKGLYRSLRTYLYTCIRNEISNYLYHTHKRTKESSDGLIFCKTRFKHSSIDNKYVELVFKKLSSRYLVYKEFVSKLIEILSDSDSFTDDDGFFEELKLRNKSFGLNFPENEIKNHIFDLLSPIEKQIIILIVNEVKKDTIH